MGQVYLLLWRKPGKRMLDEYGLRSQEWQIKSWERRVEQILSLPGLQIIHRGDWSCPPRSCFSVQLSETEEVPAPQVTVYDMSVLAFAYIFHYSGFKCLLTQSLRIPSETCASRQLTVTPCVSPPPPHYLSGRQQVFCDSEIRESWKDGAPPELDCLCRRRENLCFHFQSLSSRLSHPQTTAAPVQYMYVPCSRLWLADRGLFSCTRGQRRRSSAPSTGGLAHLSCM